MQNNNREVQFNNLKKVHRRYNTQQKVQNVKQITNACYRTSEKNPIHNKCIHQRKQGMFNFHTSSSFGNKSLTHKKLKYPRLKKTPFLLHMIPAIYSVFIWVSWFLFFIQI